MRVEFADAILKLKDEFPESIFITGDLGYMALEKVEAKYGEHFINAGVAEQNMITVAAGLAHEGFTPWCYSISPFVTLRPYEQIRNDVCLHNLPVKIVGNGGGFGYGIMGATHHNIEDIGALRLLQNMRIVIPFNSTDVEQAMRWMTKDKHPNYLRLNLAAKTKVDKPFEQWRKVKDGSKGVAIGTGPVLENILNLEEAKDVEVWVLSIFPVTEIPVELAAKINATKKVLTIEEHQGQCGMHETLASLFLQQKIQVETFLPLYATGYPSGKYGNQQWHQEENGLLGEKLKTAVQKLIQ